MRTNVFANLKKSNAGNTSFVTSIMLVQLSLFALYYRLFEASRSTRLAIYFGAAAVVVFYTGLLAVFLASCLPRPGQSMLYAAAAPRCTKYEELRFYALSTFTVVSDAFLVAVPMRVVWGLRQLSTARKSALTAIFLHGLLCVNRFPCVAHLHRLHLLLHELAFTFTTCCPPLPLMPDRKRKGSGGVACGALQNSHSTGPYMLSNSHLAWLSSYRSATSTNPLLQRRYALCSTGSGSQYSHWLR
jgi:hypothetical protein